MQPATCHVQPVTFKEKNMKPKVIIFNGLSLDGRMDYGSGTIDMGLYYGLASRWNAEAMLSGSNTMLAMNTPEVMPELETYQPPAEYHPLAVPLMVVVDSRGRIRNWNALRSQPFWRKVVVLCSNATPKEYRAYLEQREVETIVTGDEHVDYRLALEELNTRFGVKVVRVDSGGILNGLLLRAGLVDEVSILIDPCLVGGTSPRTIFNAPDLPSGDSILRLKLIHHELVKDDVLWLRYEITS
jgi:2,5-diamino-6-(ribosylamino)-4(3H)-pyrimidinone 5'-phosphate reductase